MPISYGDLNSVSMLSQDSAYSSQDTVSKGINTALATLVDVGTSMWNSTGGLLTGNDLSTRSLLQSIGADGAVAAYDANQDTVQALSFVGGIFIPGMAATKLTSAIRAGMKGTSFLSDARHVEDLAKYENLLQNAQQGTSEFKAVRNGIYARGIANNTIDAAAAEAAVMLTFNAHPYMEDYLKDPVSNFALSLAVGGGIGGLIGSALNKVELGAIAGRTESTALGAVKDAAWLHQMPASDTASSLVSLKLAADNLDNIAAMQVTRPDVAVAAKQWSLSLRESAGNILKANSSDAIQNLPKEDLAKVRAVFESPEMLGAEKLDFYKPKEIGYSQSGPNINTAASANFDASTVIKSGPNKGEVNAAIKPVHYSQDIKAFVDSDTAQQIANAADSFTPDSLPVKQFSTKVFQNKAGELQDFGTTAEVEGQHLAALSFYSKLSTAELKQIELYSNDLPAINGYLSAVQAKKTQLTAIINDGTAAQATRAAAVDELAELHQATAKVYQQEKVRLVNVEDTGSTTVPVSYDPSSYVKPTHIEDVSQAIESGEIKPLLNKQLGFGEARSISSKFDNYVRAQTGKPLASVTTKEQEALAKRFAQENASDLQKYATEGSGLSDSAILMLARWIGGKYEDKEAFRNAMASARTLRAGMESTTPYHDDLVNILNSPLTKQARDVLLRNGDAKGNVYMYRGLKTASAGDTPVSSYTYNKAVASNFNKDGVDPSLFKVNANDVVGYLYHGEREWLVGASTRDALDSLPTTGALPPKPLGNQSKIYKQTPAAQLQSGYLLQKAQAIQDAVNGGMPKEVAALRYNVPNDMVDLAMAEPENFLRYADKKGAEAWSTLNRWSSAEQIPEALSPTRRTLTVTAQKDKILGDTGAILQQQREAILGKIALTSTTKAMLNQAASASSQHIDQRVAAINNMYASIHKQWIDAAVAANPSPMMQALNKLLDDGSVKALGEGLNQFVNGKGGNPLYQSADFLTSKMGDIGKIVTYIGDKRTHLANEHFERIINPVASAFKKFENDPAARTEFAVWDNIRQSNKGHMYYDSQKATFITGDLDTATGAYKPGTERPVTNLTVKHAAVDEALRALQDAGQDIRVNQKALNRIKGQQAPNDIGFWTPSFTIQGKERAYVVNHDNGTIKLLLGHTPDDLRDMVANYKVASNETVMTASELERTNAGAMDDMLRMVTKADTEKLKKGVGLVGGDLSPDRLADIVNGLRDRVNYQASNFVENALFDTMQKLDVMSQANKNFYDRKANPEGFRKAIKELTTKDTAADIKDIILGKNPAYRSSFITGINKTTSATIQVGLNAFNAAYSVVKPANPFAKDVKIDYDKFKTALEAQGIRDPYEAFHEAARPFMLERAKNSGYSVTPDRIINSGNALAATMALRFLEVAQPIVNMMSMPILSISTINRSIKAANIERADELLKGNSLAIMMGGIRRMNSSSPDNLRYMKLFEDDGLLKPIVSEVDDVIKSSRFGTGSFVGGLEKALDSKFVDLLSKPSEYGETLTRKASLMTGVELAKRIYGNNATDTQVAIFARDFMKQSLGNYSTAQRPMMFQGSFGAAAGLFQTYMLTYAQSLYRHLELKDYKGLGATMLAQAGIFGVGSLPGFQAVSQAIGSHFSDEHYDLNTGTFRALGDPIASALLYGLPSSIAPDVHSRGDVNPRVPTGFSTLVAPSMILQTMESLVKVGKSIGQQDIGAGQAFMEALSQQSVSRPLARLSELATGRSVTGAGNQIAGPEEVWSWQGIVARTLSTRPLSESKVREAINLHSVYGAVDSDNRKAVLTRMRTAIRADNLDADLIDKLAFDYLRTGSPQGFRSAMNQAIMENSETKLIQLQQKFGSSPLMLMMDDLD